MNLNSLKLSTRVKLSTHFLVGIISTLALTWILLYKLLFQKMDTLFIGAIELGEIFFGLFASIFASGVFYFFVVYLPDRRTKRITNPIIANRLGTFGTALFHMKRGLYEHKKLPIPERLPSMEEFSRICEDITLDDPAPIISGNPSFQPNNWYEYFEYFFNSDRYLSRLLYDQITYLEPRVVELLDDIQYSVFQRALEMYKNDPQFDQLSGTANPCWAYMMTIQNLSDIAQEMKKADNRR